MINIDKALLVAGNFHEYDEASAKNKAALHSKGKTFLKKLAGELGLTAYDLHSNKAGIAVSGEVTLHSDNLYVQMAESFGRPGLVILYRSCTSRKDYRGGTNNYATVADLDDALSQDRFIANCKRLMAQGV